MKIRDSAFLLLLILTFGGSGCSTKIKVSQLDPKLAKNAVVDGLPFRTKERYYIKLYRLNGLTYEPVDTKSHTADLANLDQLYVMRIVGSPLSDGTVTIKLNEDNTLGSVKVESTSKGQDALKALGQAEKDIAEAEESRNKKEDDQATATENERVASEDKILAALTAKHDYELAVQKLAALSETATILERTEAEQLIEKNRLIANNKARQAGLPANF